MQITSSTNPYSSSVQTNETVQAKPTAQSTELNKQTATAGETVQISAAALAKLADEQSAQTLGSGWGNEPTVTEPEDVPLQPQTFSTQSDTAPGSGWGNEPPVNK